MRREYVRLPTGEIKQKMTVNVTCECGTEVKHDGLAKHKRTTRHAQRMKGEVPNESQPKPLYISCPFGTELTRGHISRHTKTLKHQEWLENKS